jgi:hypothetical protein
VPSGSSETARYHRPDHSNEQLFDHEAGTPAPEILLIASTGRGQPGPNLERQFTHVDRGGGIDRIQLGQAPSRVEWT